MGGSPFTRVKENAREQLLSADLNRDLGLMSRDLQDAFKDLGSDWAGIPISGLTRKLSIVPVAATFTMTMGANTGFFHDASFPGLTPDDSPYMVMRWGAQALAFAAPDGVNGRLDLIVADPSTEDVDLQSRNILLDPVSRAFAPQNVFKTTNPATVLSVITGVAGGAPVPPAVPSHKVAVAEIFVPAGVSDATFFQVVPRLWRKSFHPGCTLNGPVSGCDLIWDLSVDPASASAAISLGAAGGRSFLASSIFIDGELLEFNAGPVVPVFADATASPFATNAPTNAARPYYVYLCGGRNLPQSAVVGGNVYPFVLVESTVTPDSEGHPTSNITTPRGVTKLGAVYVGLGFVYRGTTHRQNCVMVDGETFGANVGLESIVGASSPTTFASAPSLTLDQRKVAFHATVTTTGAETLAGIAINPTAASGPATTVSLATAIETIAVASSTGALGLTRQITVLLGSFPSVTWVTHSASTVSFNVAGYSHGVHRVRGR